jgi:RNA polymerase sigma-70 factor (ECF subfamily)
MAGSVILGNVVRRIESARGSVSESELVSRAVAGDAAAQRALYDSHVDRVYRLTYRLSGDDELARDYTQETFIRAFDRLDSFRRESAFGTWLYAIAMSVTLNGLRSVKRLRTREVALDAAESLGGGRAPVDPDLRDRLHRAIDALPQGYRTVFVMHDVEGFTHEEIGQALGIQTGTSKAQLFRARARLREALADFKGAWSA